MRRLRFAALSLMLKPVLGTRAVPVILVEGGSFRDLNRNGALDPYEDWRLPVPRRVVDLVARMTLDEKAGTLMHGTAPSPWGGPPSDAGYDVAAAERVILGAHVHTLITVPSSMADVEAQSPGRPHDTRHPLYRIGAGGPADGSARR